MFGGERNKIKINFCDTLKLYKIQISVSIDRVLLEYRYAHSFMYYALVLSVATFWYNIGVE